MELEINKIRYITGRLTAFEQFHIMRRLAPLLSGLGESLAKLPTTAPNENGAAADVSDEDVWNAIGPVANVLSKMSDADTDYVLKHCLSKITRFNGQNWVPIMAQGNLMFEDIDLSAMMNLTISTVQENLASFFPAAPAKSLAADSQSTSNSSQ